MTSRDDVATRFANDIAEHEMTVLHDDGLYRHVMFKIPRTNMYRFDLITWPGHLAIAGDMGSCTFKRLEDMFTFFNEPRVNLGYWAEKVIAGEIRQHSEDLFRVRVTDEFNRARNDNGGGYDDAHWDEVWERLEEEVLSGGYHEEVANQAVYDWNSSTGADLGFEINTDDWNTQDYTYRFMWQCHAIRWGVWKYYRAMQTANSSS